MTARPAQIEIPKPVEPENPLIILGHESPVKLEKKKKDGGQMYPTPPPEVVEE